MKAHGAEYLVDNLARGASSAQLDGCEARIGFRLPDDLRSLWAVHAGQLDEGNGFVSAMNFLGPEAGEAEAENVAMFLEFLREAPSDWEEAGVTQEEVESDAWIAFAGQGYSALLVVSGVTGRVFTCGKDSPPLGFIASSILDWIEAYADRVDAGEYTIEEGYGWLARASAMY